MYDLLYRIFNGVEAWSFRVYILWLEERGEGWVQDWVQERRKRGEGIGERGEGSREVRDGERKVQLVFKV